MRKLFILVLTILTLSMVGCDWFNGSPTEVKPPVEKYHFIVTMKAPPVEVINWRMTVNYGFGDKSYPDQSFDNKSTCRFDSVYDDQKPVTLTVTGALDTAVKGVYYLAPTNDYPKWKPWGPDTWYVELEVQNP